MQEKIVEQNQVVVAESVEPVEQVKEQVAEERVEQVAVEKPVDLSAHFAEIKRRDRELLSERQKIKEERNKFEQEKVQLKKQWEQDLVQDAFGKEEPTEHEITQNELSELKAWRHKLEEEKQAQVQSQRIEQAKTQVFTSLDSTKHELVLASSQGKELLWNALLQYGESHGEAPDVMAMADLVENQLLEEGKKLFSTAKFKPVEPKQEKVKVEVAPKNDTSQQGGFTTISNSMTAKSSPKVQLVDMKTSGQLSLQTPISSYMAEKRQAMLDKLKVQG